jgi:RNA polymerase-binding transcription factor DksA
MRSGATLGRTTLSRLAAELRRRLAATTEAASGFHDEAEAAIGSADVSDILDADDPEGANAEESLMLAVAADEQVEEIRQALRKIDLGTYGVCEDCGRRIPLERLRAIPATPVCIECSRRRSADHHRPAPVGD